MPIWFAIIAYLSRRLFHCIKHIMTMFPTSPYRGVLQPESDFRTQSDERIYSWTNPWSMEVRYFPSEQMRERYIREIIDSAQARLRPGMLRRSEMEVYQWVISVMPGLMYVENDPIRYRIVCRGLRAPDWTSICELSLSMEEAARIADTGSLQYLQQQTRAAQHAEATAMAMSLLGQSAEHAARAFEAMSTAMHAIPAPPTPQKEDKATPSPSITRNRLWRAEIPKPAPQPLSLSLPAQQRRMRGRK